MEATTADRWVAGGSMAIGAGAGAIIGTMIAPGIGTAIGAFAGTIVGGISAAIIKHEMHLAELQRKDRVDAAMKVIDSIDNMGDALDNINTAVQSLDMNNSADRQIMKDYVADLKNSMLGDTDMNIYNRLSDEFKAANNNKNSSLSGTNLTVSKYIDLLYNGTEE